MERYDSRPRWPVTLATAALITAGMWGVFGKLVLHAAA